MEIRTRNSYLNTGFSFDPACPNGFTLFVRAHVGGGGDVAVATGGAHLHSDSNDDKRGRRKPHAPLHPPPLFL